MDSHQGPSEVEQAKLLTEQAVGVFVLCDSGSDAFASLLLEASSSLVRLREICLSFSGTPAVCAEAMAALKARPRLRPGAPMASVPLNSLARRSARAPPPGGGRHSERGADGAAGALCG